MVGAFLLSMQAAGLVVSAFSTHQQSKQIALGRKLENMQYENNMQALGLRAEQESLAALDEVRQNIGSQIVMNAAMGRRGGSAESGIVQSEKAYKEDENTRRMNLLAKQSDLRSSHLLSGMELLSSETKLGQKLASDVFGTMQTGEVGKWANKKFDSLLGNAPKKASNNATANTGKNPAWGV